MIAAARSSGMAIPSIVRRISALSVRIASPVIRAQARQPIEPAVDRRRVRHDPLEGIRRHAEAGRHADAFDPRELPQVCALAADDRDLCLVDLVESQHVAAHRTPIPFGPLGPVLSPLSIVPTACGPAPGVHCQHALGACGKTPTLVYLGMAGRVWRSWRYRNPVCRRARSCRWPRRVHTSPPSTSPAHQNGSGGGPRRREGERRILPTSDHARSTVSLGPSSRNRSPRMSPFRIGQRWRWA